MNNKTIWITGASSGIGKSLALKFAQEGWKVAISARRENLLDEISKSNENIITFPLDVTDNEKCKSVFSQVKEKLDSYKNNPLTEEVVKEVFYIQDLLAEITK